MMFTHSKQRDIRVSNNYNALIIYNINHTGATCIYIQVLHIIVCLDFSGYYIFWQGGFVYEKDDIMSLKTENK